MLDPSTISISIFVLVYVLFIFFPRWRTWNAVAGAILLILLGAMTAPQAFKAINWNVMGIFVGTLVIADLFMESRVPAFLAEVIVTKSRNTCWSILLICLMTGFISAFVENVATVLIVAPIALAMAKKLEIKPVNMMIAIAISSNLQGAATLIGDPPSMLLAGYAKMNFGDFFFYQGKPGIFFAVQLGALASLVVLYLLFRRHREKTAIICIENITSWVPTVMLVALIVLLALSSFFDTGFSYAAGIICMIIGALGLIWAKVFNKVKIIPSIKKLDWETTFFLMGVFVLVGSLTANGWIDRIAAFFTSSIGDNLFLGYTFLVLVAMIVSAFVDNVPFLAAMLPVAIAMGKDLNIDPTLFLFGLLIGASLGGNITPIGASANIVACSLLRKEGYHVGFGQFAKIGVPFTLVAVAAAYLFVWFIWT